MPRSFLDMLRSRRSIRKYRPERLEPETVDLLREIALRSPSSRGINPWRFVFVQSPETLRKLAESKAHGSAFLAGAALGVVVCAEESESDVWVEDCSIASTLLHLGAHSLGLGSCWIQIRNRRSADGTSSEERIRDVLGLPDTFRVESIVGVGRPAETKEGVPEEELQFDKIRDEEWS